MESEIEATNGTECVEFNDVDNLMLRCRVCMIEATNMRHIFAETDNFIEKIQFCTGLQLTHEDGLPSNICEVCIQNLIISYQFKTLCLQTDDTLRNLSYKIKVEPESSDDCAAEIDNSDLNDEAENNIRRNSRFQIKKEIESTENVKPKKGSRGPYRKGNNVPRQRKFKYRRLQCETCNIKFTTKAQSIEHRNRLHKQEDWICEMCGKTFKSRGSHHSHVKTHFPPQFHCDYCDHRTWHKHDLLKHINKHMGVKKYQCEFCPAAYTDSSNLMTHVRRGHEGHTKKYECPTCQKKFFERTKLRRHIDTHNNIKRHECEVCHAMFSRRCSWKQHLFRVHNITVPPQRPGRQNTNFIAGESMVTAKGVKT